MLIFLSTLLVLATVAALILPILWQQKTIVGRKSGTMAIFRDQLNEIDTDIKRGVLSETEAESARIEIKRRILALEKLENAADEQADGTIKPSRSGWWLPISGAVFIPIFAIGLYAMLGSPDTPSRAYASRTAETQEAARIADLTKRLRQRLEADPKSPTEAWILLGQTYMKMGRYDDAVYAFAQLINRPDATSGTYSQLAEALFAAESGIVTPKAEAAADRALVLDADNVAGTYYKALALDQSGAQRQAFAMLKERLERENSFAQWMPALLAQANRIAAAIGEPPVQIGPVASTNAPGPTASDVEAASDMNPKDRQAFILSMVERLAERLEDEPGDLDGWLRLARAYVVLGDKAKALNAYKSAQKLLAPLPADDERRRIVSDGLSQLKG